MSKEQPQQSAPGDGIRSLKTSGFFRAVNFELYVKPNAIIMGLGIIAITLSAGYIGYMRYSYEQRGYYSAVEEDGTEAFKKKQSRWD